MARTRVHYNDDGQVLAEIANGWDYKPGHAVEFIREWIDRITEHTPIDIYAICVASPDRCHYETKVGEAGRGAAVNQLRKEGADFLNVYTQRLHEKGIGAVASIRMSDTHHRRIEDTPIFTQKHPEWIIQRSDGIQEVAMDYSYPEVREHRLAIMREIAEEYDVDGLELDFNRWAKHFQRHLGREKAPIMTAYMGQIDEMLKEAAEKRGRDHLILGVRVLGTLEECWNCGLDPKAWVKNGWVDYMVVCEPNCTWPMMHVEEFAAFTRGTKCELYAQMGDMMGGSWSGKPEIKDRGLAQSPAHKGYSGMLLTSEEAKAAAYNFYTWGAQGISFWNIACNMGHGLSLIHI